MNTTTQWDVLIGAAMPALIAVVNQAHWSAKAKAVVALLLCAAVAAGVDAARGDLHWNNWRATIIVIAGTAFGLYQWWWRPSTIAPTIEKATSITPTRVP